MARVAERSHLTADEYLAWERDSLFAMNSSMARCSRWPAAACVTMRSARASSNLLGAQLRACSTYPATDPSWRFAARAGRDRRTPMLPAPEDRNSLLRAQGPAG